MFYRVFAYSPEPIGEPASPCLVVILDDILSSSEKPSMFLPIGWSRLIAPRHQEYILALANDWDGRSSELAISLELIEELAVGLLRISARGSCTKAELPTLLESIFGRSGYILVGPDLLSGVPRSQ
jgi:hypothetical protein